MAELKTTIIAVRNVPLVDPQKGFVPGMAVDYKVGDHGPFTVTVPATGYTAAAVKQLVEQAAAEIRSTLT